jgi:hypothetical protein
LRTDGDYFGYPCDPSHIECESYGRRRCAADNGLFLVAQYEGTPRIFGDALKIMYVTTVMVVILIFWSGLTMLQRSDAQKLPPAPVPHNLAFDRDAVGWLPDVAPGALREITPEALLRIHLFLIVLTANTRFGLISECGRVARAHRHSDGIRHSFLAMSGEESLAQVQPRTRVSEA